MLEQIDVVRLQSTPETERHAANFIDDALKGFGPKQSRNLLQALGLSRFEVPIDGRVTKWLNEFGFAFKIGLSALADRDYYNLVSAGFQKLADKAGIEPCLLDAAIFASYDGDSWTDGNAEALP